MLFKNKELEIKIKGIDTLRTERKRVRERGRKVKLRTILRSFTVTRYILGRFFCQRR